ncbi:MAG TPA: DUF3574 domain-containing protein [Hyphomicrobiaceae bacterium]|nr:DUF3574 domain-containing protein [Hyphomicrobiaceae bacterium]
MSEQVPNRLVRVLGGLGAVAALAITLFVANRPPPPEAETAPDNAVLTPNATVVPAPAMQCPEESRLMTRLELVFGMSRKGAEPVSDVEWQEFLDAEITPRFPDGLTVLVGYGQWKGGDGKIAKEASRILLVWHTPDETTEQRIVAIREAWKVRFKQESVLRAESAASCVSF